MKTGKIYPQGDFNADTWQKIHEATIATLDSATKLLVRGDAIADATGKAITNSANYDTYTKLASHFDGADEAQAYSDPIAGAYTFEGTAQLDTAQKKFGTASLLLDGDSDYVYLGDSDDWNLGSGSFTIDLWVRWNSSTANCTFIQQKLANTYYRLGYTKINPSSGYLFFRVYNAGDSLIDHSGGSFVPAADTWYHIAIVRDGNSLKSYIGGVQNYSEDVTGITIPDVASNLVIGFDEVSTYFGGWIDMPRISKGIARWTANFTPPDKAYGTVASIYSQKKFDQVNGALEFDGSGSYITLLDSDDWNLGSGSFTADAWVKFNSLPIAGTTSVISHWKETGNLMSWLFGFRNESGNYYLRFSYTTDGTTGTRQLLKSNAISISTGTWYHIAFIRNGNTFTYYFDGTAVGTVDLTGVTFFDSSTNLSIGATNEPASYFDGYLSMVRLIKGSALWTSNFTPPVYNDYYGAATQYVITGLDGNTDEEYRLIMRPKNDSTGAAGYYMRPNNDTGVNYGYQLISGVAADVAAGQSTTREEFLIGASLATNDIALMNLILYAKSGYVRTLLLEDIRGVTGTTVNRIRLICESWNNTVDNITSLVIYSNLTNGLGVGTQIELYRKSKKV